MQYAEALITSHLSSLNRIKEVEVVALGFVQYNCLVNCSGGRINFVEAAVCNFVALFQMHCKVTETLLSVAVEQRLVSDHKDEFIVLIPLTTFNELLVPHSDATSVRDGYELIPTTARTIRACIGFN